MIDLSNNNVGAVEFHVLHTAGHTNRVYLKRSEGTDFTDGRFDGYYRRAIAAGLKVGAYHFAHPEKNTAKAEAAFFARLLPARHYGKTLRPCLDLEAGEPSQKTATWAADFLAYLHEATGRRGIIYSNPSYLSQCRFHKAPGPLWLAAYGRDDGKEYPFHVPSPWKHAAAHQYASTAKVPGVDGPVDISHVLHPRQLDELRLGIL